MEHSAILLTCTKQPPVFKTFVLSIFEWSLKTGFTVLPLLSEAGLGLGGTAGFNLQMKKET